MSHPSFQSIGVLPNFLRASFVCEKCLQPMNFVTESGDGCAPFITQCFVASINFSFFCAKPPHRMNTILSPSSLNFLMTWSVNFCHPSFAWEFAWCALKRMKLCQMAGFHCLFLSSFRCTNTCMLRCTGMASMNNNNNDNNMFTCKYSWFEKNNYDISSSVTDPIKSPLIRPVLKTLPFRFN